MESIQLVDRDWIYTLRCRYSLSINWTLQFVKCPGNGQPTQEANTPPTTLSIEHSFNFKPTSIYDRGLIKIAMF